MTSNVSQSVSALASSVVSSPGCAPPSVSAVSPAAGTGERATLIFAPGTGAATAGAGTKLNPEDDGAGACAPLAFAMLFPDENVVVLAATGDCAVLPPKEKGAGADEGVNREGVVFVVPVDATGAGAAGVAFGGLVAPPVGLFSSSCASRDA